MCKTLTFFIYSKVYLFYNNVGVNINSIGFILSGIGNNFEALIDVKKLKIIFNGKERYISQSNIDELIRIIRTWKSDYGSTGDIIDQESLYISINFEDCL